MPQWAFHLSVAYANIAQNTAANAGLSFQHEMKREMFEIMDRLTSEIDGRFQHLKAVNDKFAFLQLNNLLEPENELTETQHCMMRSMATN